MNSYQYGAPLSSEILPGLWQGGTHDNDTVGGFGFGQYQAGKDDFNATEDLYELVQTAHRDWKAGKRVLIRCQAGWNRSGLVMALTLIKDGYDPQAAIDLIRKKRVPEALSNRTFERWLLNDADLMFWRGRMAA